MRLKRRQNLGTDSSFLHKRRFRRLATQPDMGWGAKLRHSDLTGLRIFRVTSFEKILILYRPLENGVEILRVVHGSQNVQRLLRRQGPE